MTCRADCDWPRVKNARLSNPWRLRKPCRLRSVIQREFGAVQQGPQDVAVGLGPVALRILAELPAANAQLRLGRLPRVDGQEQRPQPIVVGEERGLERAE